jgi:hypothetical protein
MPDSTGKDAGATLSGAMVITSHPWKACPAVAEQSIE